MACEGSINRWFSFLDAIPPQLVGRRSRVVDGPRRLRRLRGPRLLRRRDAAAGAMAPAIPIGSLLRRSRHLLGDGPLQLDHGLLLHNGRGGALREAVHVLMRLWAGERRERHRRLLLQHTLQLVRRSRRGCFNVELPEWRGGAFAIGFDFGCAGVVLGGSAEHVAGGAFGRNRLHR